MQLISLAHEEDFAGWRDAARSLALAQIPPDEVQWQVGDEPAGPFAAGMPSPRVSAPGGFSVPRAFISLAETVICHSDPQRFALLYAFLLKLRSRPKAMEDSADPALQRLEGMAKEVRRDMHRMRAFLRFRDAPAGDGAPLIAWFEPAHHIVRITAGFFARRFAAMRWTIVTPVLSAHWDGAELRFGPGGARADALPRDATDLSEPTLVGPVAGTQTGERRMVAGPSAGIGDNVATAWEAVRDEAMGCTRCHLYKLGTQTVFGEGPLDAEIMFVGEQPGDQEDLAGRPFVGPAGQVLDRALGDAGIDRSRTYVTNAVKHFKFQPRGKRRIHQKPDGPEIEACRWWIEQERLMIRPPITVALGATAARSLFGKVVTISSTRGRPHQMEEGGETWVTVHPSYLLRIPEAERKAQEYERFVEDLVRMRKRLESLSR